MRQKAGDRGIGERGLGWRGCRCQKEGVSVPISLSSQQKQIQQTLFGDELLCVVIVHIA